MLYIEKNNDYAKLTAVEQFNYIVDDSAKYEDGIITLLKDVELYDTVRFTDDTTLDLNGFNIIGPENNYTLYVENNFTIIDSSVKQKENNANDNTNNDANNNIESNQDINQDSDQNNNQFNEVEIKSSIKSVNYNFPVIYAKNAKLNIGTTQILAADGIHGGDAIHLFNSDLTIDGAIIKAGNGADVNDDKGGDGGNAVVVYKATKQNIIKVNSGSVCGGNGGKGLGDETPDADAAISYNGIYQGGVKTGKGRKGKKGGGNGGMAINNESNKLTSKTFTNYHGVNVIDFDTPVDLIKGTYVAVVITSDEDNMGRTWIDGEGMEEVDISCTFHHTTTFKEKSFLAGPTVEFKNIYVNDAAVTGDEFNTIKNNYANDLTNAMGCHKITNANLRIKLWTNNYVTINTGDDGNIGGNTLTYYYPTLKATMSDIPIPTVTNADKKFIGYNTKADGTGKKYDENSIYSLDIADYLTLYAQYENKEQATEPSTEQTTAQTTEQTTEQTTAQTTEQTTAQSTEPSTEPTKPSIATTGFYVISKTVNNSTVADTYYIDNSGNMMTGWLNTADDKWYYFDATKDGNEGKMAIGWKQVQNDWYYFLSNGTMMINGVTPDGYTVGSDGKCTQ